MKQEITAIVLAAGLGTRMKSSKPKVLHAAAGRPLIDHVLSALKSCGVHKVRLVVGYGADQIKSHLGEPAVADWAKGVEFFLQEKQLGTADAVKSATIENLQGMVLIGNGDHPLIQDQDYKKAFDNFSDAKADLLVVSSVVKNPKGFGRIIRGGSKTKIEIVEERDATDEQRRICEINSGLYVVKAEILKEFLPRIQNKNAKQEFYLTDLVKLCVAAQKRVVVSAALSARVVRGVNTPEELALASKALYLKKARELMASGVILVDPSHTYIEADVQVGEETVIGPGCMIEKGSAIGKGCLIEGHCQIRDSRLGDGVELRWGSLIDQSQIERGALVGPYARLRPDSVVGEEAHVGNFVELKKTTLGARAKANHLTYLGDAEIGEESNIGCGTITCNYAVDRKKYRTKIGKRVFVGSDSQFVAPVSIGDDAVVASGSTITEDVPARALAIGRSRQVTKADYIKVDQGGVRGPKEKGVK